MVHKPAERHASVSALFMADILKEAGVPAGVFNVVTGSGASLGDHLVSHPHVDKVAFTGSTEIGAHAAALAAKTPHAVHRGARRKRGEHPVRRRRPRQGVGTVIAAFVFNAGQFCMAGPRLLVERPIYDTVLGILGQAVPQRALRRHHRRPRTVVGPLASQTQLDKVSAMVESARRTARRWRAVVDRRIGRIDLDGGFYYRPTVLAGLSSDAEASARRSSGRC